MSIPYALGVRIYSAPLSLDTWITQYVDDFSNRSTAPGGFASATFKIRRHNPVSQPDVTIWSSTTSAISSNTNSFQVLDANAALINTGDRFWVYNGSGIRFNGDRFTVTGKSSAGGTTTVTYSPASSGTIASGDTVMAKTAASFYDSGLIGFNKTILLFNRIQVVDLRTMEIAWEGRIEDPARETEMNTWTLGCLGTSVFASDITKPMYYMDDQVSSWLPRTQVTGGQGLSDLSSDDTSATLSVSFVDGTNYWAVGTMFAVFDNQRIQQCNLEGVGRVDWICNGNDMSADPGKLGITLNTFTWSGVSEQNNIAAYALNGTADFHASKIVGTNITGTDVHILMLAAGQVKGTAFSSTANPKGSKGYWRLPRVQPIRMDRFRNMQNTGASYPDGALKVWQVVEDVLGRFLNGGHTRDGADIPYPGNVNPYTAYVDKSYNALMVGGWNWFEGVTAKTILDKACTDAQTNAYWAIWGSSYGATDSTFNSKADFEFATWPLSWGYSLTSEDGLTEQPNGANEYDFLYYQYSYDASAAGYKYMQTWWNTGIESDLAYQQVNRSASIIRDRSITDGSMVSGEAAKWIDDNSHSTNAGSITIKRPVPFLDQGLNSNSGGARMLDPWMLRPGKLARITDMPPMAMMNDFSYSNTAPNRTLDGTIFRVVATEFNTSDGSCRMDLDEIATWDAPQQIVTLQPSAPSAISVYR